MHTQACQETEHHRADRLCNVRHAATNCAQSNRTIASDDRPVIAPIELHAQPAFTARDQGFSLRPRHSREVIDIQTAFAAKAHTLVAHHLVPIGLTRRGNLHISQRIIESSHGVLTFRSAVAIPIHRETPLWIPLIQMITKQKRRRRFALPAHSKGYAKLSACATFAVRQSAPTSTQPARPAFLSAVDR
jgi:hypothetical protein